MMKKFLVPDIPQKSAPDTKILYTPQGSSAVYIKIHIINNYIIYRVVQKKSL